MYTNTKYIFLVFQNQSRTISYNESEVSTHSHESIPNNLGYIEEATMKNSKGEILSILGIKPKKLTTFLSQTQYHISFTQGDTYKLQRQDDGTGSLSVFRDGRKLGTIPLPPDVLFQNQYTYPNFSFSLQRNKGIDSYSILDKSGKEKYKISGKNLPAFEMSISDMNTKFIAEAYDIDVREVEREIGDIKDVLGEDFMKNVNSNREIMKKLVEEIGKQHDIRDLKMNLRGKNFYIEGRSDNLISNFLEKATFIDTRVLTKIVNPLSGNSEKIETFLFDHFTLPNPDTK